MKKYKLYINGKWMNSSSGKTFKSLNPANPNEVLGIFEKGNKKDVELAITAAEKAFQSWKNVPAPKRGEILFKVAELLKKDKQRLGKLVTKEMGKVISEGLGDVQEAIDVFEYMGAEGRRLFGHTTPSELREKLCITVKKPIGIVGLITPWNFPVAIPAWKLAPALICGNTCVFKPATDTPLCALELIKILEKAGIPPGVVNFITGTGPEVGTPIIKHKKIRGISFTGSREIGTFVTENAGLKKIGLELGGKNAIIIMDDADLNLAVEGVIWGAFGTTGQRCTATSRVIIHKKVQKKFENMLIQKTKKLSIGYGINHDIGPLINKSAVEKTEKYVQIAKKEGAKILCGGKRIKKNNGYFYAPTVFTNVKTKMRIAQEEIFGPFLAIITIKNLIEAINVCNDIDYGLSSAIYTSNMRNAFIAVDQIEAGLTYVNSSTIGSEVHLPFGGVKDTGNGTREAGIEGIHEFSETKVIYVDYSSKLQKAQIDEIKVKKK